MYEIKCVGVVIDITGQIPANDGSSILTHVKSALGDGLTTLQEDDQVYVYRPTGDLAPGVTISESVAHVYNWVPTKLNVVTSLEETMLLLGQYYSRRRAVFYVTDNYKSENDGLLGHLMVTNRQRYFCDCYFYGIGRGYSASLKQTGASFEHLDHPSQLQELFLRDIARI